MIKVYRYGLNNIFITNEETKRQGVSFLHSGIKIDTSELKRVTKATVNKYLKDYKVHSYNTYVITSPILSAFAQDIETKELHTNRAKRDYLGTFNSYEEVENHFKTLYELTKDLRKENHFVNFESSLMAAMLKLNNEELRIDDQEEEILNIIKKKETQQ